MITGEAGIGKTALLEYAVAQASGMTVLRAAGVESESEIPFAGLLTLLRPVLGRIDELPAPQADALRAALGLAAGAGGDRFLIGAATLTLLTACAEHSPVLVVIDDAQWIDESSLAAILFAARRLLADALAIVVASRAGPFGLPELSLPGLDRATAAALLERHAGRALPPGAADRAFEATLGNPLALVELAGVGRSVAAGGRRAGAHERGSRLRRPRPRVARTHPAPPGPGRRGRGGEPGRDRGRRPRWTRARSPPRKQAGLVALALDRLVFCHPLARAAAYRCAAPDERRAAHAALAQVEPDADRRAWHRAAATLGPDAEVADELEGAGLRARERGAYTAAASSLERAARLTADPPARARRLFQAAEAAWLAGHAERADERLADARALCEDPQLRVEIDHLRGHAALRGGNVRAAHDILVEAARHAAPEQAVEMLAEATDASGFAADPARMLDAARRAQATLTPAIVAAGPGAGDARARHGPHLLGRGRGAAAARGDRHPRRRAGPRDRPDPARVGRDRRALAQRGAARPRADPAGDRHRPPAGRRRRAAVPALARRARRGHVRPAARGGRALRGGDPARAGDRAGHEPVRRAGGPRVRGSPSGPRDPARGARRSSSREQLGLAFFELWALDALAELELGRGNPTPRSSTCARSSSSSPSAASRTPTSPPCPISPRSTRTRRSRPSQHAAVAKGQPWSLARLARAQGDYERALDLHARTPDRFETARTLLAQGEALRRARQRAQAREPLRAAIATFDALGAAPWAERARRELQASGETARRRDPLTLDALTPRELQVALVVAEGHTIRETAGKLFLSPKTVDHHLQSVYRKLAIDSRAALAEALQDPLPMRAPDARDLASPHVHTDDRRGQGQRVRDERRRGARRHAERRARGDRRPARPLQGDGRRGRAHPARARGPHADQRALRARVAQRPGRGRLRHLRGRPLHAPRRARARARRRGQPRVPARRVPADDRRRPGRAEDRRGLQERRGRRLAPAQPRPVRGLRALLPPRLPAQPDAVLDSRAGRRRGQAARSARASPTSAAATAPPR